MKPSKTLPWAIAILLLLALGIVAWQWHKAKQTNQTLLHQLDEVQSDKGRVKSELADLLVAYEQMETSNQSLNAELKKEREKIEKMIAELQNVNVTNAIAIARYKREIGTLREVMRSFVRQIDSLNTKNQHLEAQINQTRQKYQTAIEQTQALQSHSDSLRTQVKLAEILKAENITCQALNPRGNSTTRASKTQKIHVAFSLRDNPVAPRGTRPVYLVILYQQNQTTQEIFHNDIQSGQFQYFGPNNQIQQSGYSAMRAIDYQGRNLQTEIYFDITGQTPAGDYTIQLYSAQYLIGQQSLKLK
jgi:peptidoglycan hydrolase CwlO-like protein